MRPPRRLGEILIAAGAALLAVVPAAERAAAGVVDRYDVVPDGLERTLCSAGVRWLHCSAP